MNTEQIRAIFESRYGVKAIDYDCTKPLPRKKGVVAVEICENGDVYTHSKGGTSYVNVVKGIIPKMDSGS